MREPVNYFVIIACPGPIPDTIERDLCPCQLLAGRAEAHVEDGAVVLVVEL